MPRIPSLRRMRSRIGSLVLGAAALLLATPAGGSAQTLSLRVEDGVLSVTAVNVTLRDVLEHWAQVTGGTVVNGEHLPAAPVSLTLDSVTEREAFATLLRDVSGYILTMRPEPQGRTGSSVARILVAPFAKSAAANLPQPPRSVDPQIDRNPVADEPPAVEVPNARADAAGPAAAAGAAAVSSPGRSAVTNSPFGVASGSLQPGVISPVPTPSAPDVLIESPVRTRPLGPTRPQDLPQEAQDLLPK